MKALYYIALLLPMIVFLTNLDKNNKKIITFSIIPIVMIIIFRFGSGVDYFSYEYIYNQMNVSSVGSFFKETQGVEIGYRLLMLLPKIFNLPFHIFVAIYTTIIFSFFIKWIFDSSEEPIISIVLFYSMFFIVWNLSALRQGLVLAVGTYFFFNKKIDLNIKQKILLVFLLSSVHMSGLIYLFFIIAEVLDLDIKYLVLFFIISLLTSLVPWYKILPFIPSMPFLKRLVAYLGTPTGVFNFSGIIRILIFGCVLLFIPLLEKDAYNIKLAKQVLFGTSLYFLFKFSDIVAGRIGVYSFVLVVVLFVNIYDKLKLRKLVKLCLVLVIFAGSFIFFQKEIQTYQKQVGLIHTKKYLNFESILNYDRNNYYNRYNNNTYQRLACIARREKFIEEKKSQSKLVNYTDGDLLVIVETNGYYGIINQESNWIHLPTIKDDVELRGTVLKSSAGYFDLTGKGRPHEQLIIEYEKEKSLDEEFMKEEFVDNGMLFKDLHITSRRLILLPEKIKQAEILYKNSPELYYRSKISYLSQPAYIYSDASQRAIVDHIYPTESFFDRQGIMKIESYCGLDYINIDGTILWME